MISEGGTFELLAPGPSSRAALGALSSYPDAKHRFQGFRPGVHQFLPVSIYAFDTEDSAYSRDEPANTSGEVRSILLCPVDRTGSAATLSASGLSSRHGYDSAYSMDLYNNTENYS